MGNHRKNRVVVAALAQFTAVIDITDIGLNLTHDSFDADRDDVIARAEAAGVTRFILTGTTVTHSAKALELARARPDRFFSTAGIHPHHARDYDEYALDALRSLLANPEVVAVGECGLDFFRDFSPRDVQEAAFAAQLDLAAESGLPVFLHQRDAFEPFINRLRSARGNLAGGVAHCFTGDADQVRALVDLDLYIGITGWLCDERRGGALREAVPAIPLDRLLIETDAPYLLPRNLPEKPKSRRNEPRHLPHVLAELAALLGEPPERVAAATQANAERLFRLG